MPTATANPQRRAPRQARATLRRAKFLDIAAQLIGKSGYEAVTMTAIAEQAEASIGTLYDYFPDKPSIAFALMVQYSEELDEHWKILLHDSRTRPELADRFIDGALSLVRERPAYLPLLGAPVHYTRSHAMRRPLRMTIVAALQTLKPTLPEDAAFIHAEVIVQLIKGLLSVYRESVPKERERVVAEFKKLMRLYLTDTLR